MAEPDDVTTVRLLIADTHSDEAKRILSDAQVAAFLDLEEGNVKLAAASALEAIARSEVLVSKVIKSQDLSTDGAKVAAELRASAAVLREQADEGYFDVVDFAPFPTSGPELT